MIKVGREYEWTKPGYSGRIEVLSVIDGVVSYYLPHSRNISGTCYRSLKEFEASVIPVSQFDDLIDLVEEVQIG